MNRKIILESEFTCPKCGFKKTETMPTDSCLYFYQCTNCGEVIRPKPGDCCVFCSYGSVKCPVKQKEEQQKLKPESPNQGSRP